MFLSACSDGEVLVLGSAQPVPFSFGPPTVIAELSADAKTDNPSLTADLLEIFFTSDRGGNADVWSARRARVDLLFDAPVQVSEVNSPTIETSSVISADGLTLWVGSERPGGLGELDIWLSERTARGARWSTPVNILELNSPNKDVPRPLGLHATVMPLGSDRKVRGFYQIYLAERSNTASRFDAPEPVPTLQFDGKSTVDGFLTDDGLTLFYVSGPALGAADLFVAARKATADPFGGPVPLHELNSASDERDPFLSADGAHFFFSSDRSGRYEIYTADASRRPVPVAP